MRLGRRYLVSYIISAQLYAHLTAVVGSLLDTAASALSECPLLCSWFL